MKKVVAIGGGTGLATLLRGLKKYPYKITAIVTMTDDGASTGRLRREAGMLPPGDIRKCIAALAKNESAILELFNYRFKRGFGITGHSMGNLFLTALTDQTGSFEGAIEKASDILNINGKVLPATLEDVHLGAEFVDNMKIMGEVRITQYGYKMRIKKLFLNKEAPSNPRAVKAIKEADYILVGPGSLFTSILPNFLHQEIKDEFKKSKAKKIYIANVSTERGETDDFKLSDHYKEIKRYAGDVDLILANNRRLKVGSDDGYVTPVKVDLKSKVILSEISNKNNPLYHNSEKLAEAISKIT
ncbi:YvcK family protein [Patescibacteria group bacterium]|nr:YvcK family protein [Patescibacteria group bacterium]